MNKAFTLAEVLITLGIIGIVASMTLPALINKTKDREFKTAYKKAYSSFSQAFLYMQAAGEYMDTSNVNTDPSGLQVSPNIGENFKIISRYFKATKTCFDKNADDCWACADGQAGVIGGGEPAWLGCQKSSYAFIDASGMGWYMYANNEFPVIVDVNGIKKPNRLGKDRFVLMFASSQDKNNHYVESADIIMPWGDHINKGRWCPSGNCLYQTWLLE